MVGKKKSAKLLVCAPQQSIYISSVTKLKLSLQLPLKKPNQKLYEVIINIFLYMHQINYITMMYRKQDICE